MPVHFKTLNSEMADTYVDKSLNNCLPYCFPLHTVVHSLIRKLRIYLSVSRCGYMSSSIKKSPLDFPQAINMFVRMLSGNVCVSSQMHIGPMSFDPQCMLILLLTTLHAPVNDNPQSMFILLL